MHNFKELHVWKLSKDLCKEIYSVTNSFPDSEKYGLIGQLNRAAMSIPSNIAEGSSRKSDKDFSRFIDIALGSSFEVETQIIIASDLKLIDETIFLKIEKSIQQVQKMLYKFNQHLK